MSFKVLKKGSKGDMVKALQYIVNAKADGIFGNETEDKVRMYQLNNDLAPDGKAGKETFKVIVNHAPVLSFGSVGNYVFALEVLLETMKQDGIYKEDEIAHVKAYQASMDLKQDGKVGKKTWSALFRVDEENKIVENVVSNNGTNTVQPVYYLQGDSRWKKVIFTKNNTYNKNQNIGNSGCGITSAAMIVSTWWEKNITPVDTAAECVAKGYRTSNSGTHPDYFKYLSKKYSASKYIATSSFETAKNIIDQGGYVIVNVGPSVWTKGGWHNGLVTR